MKIKWWLGWNYHCKLLESFTFQRQPWYSLGVQRFTFWGFYKFSLICSEIFTIMLQFSPKGVLNVTWMSLMQNLVQLKKDDVHS